MRNSKKYIFNILISSTIILCILLGVWQISRGQEKADLINKAKKYNLNSAKYFTTKTPAPKQYSFIKIQGEYLPTIFLLDNQHYLHNFGYNIILALKTQGNNIIFVDNGFIKGDITRTFFPTFKIPKGLQKLRGQVYYPKIAGWSLGETIEKLKPNKFVIENLDLKKLAALVNTKTLPFVLRSYPAKKDSLIHSWPIVTMTPARHYGYAVQWFGIALVITIVFFLKKNDL